MARTAAAVLEASACVVGGGWGNHRQFHAVFNFYAANRRCRAFVARDREGRIAGTSVATRYGISGWIGHVFVRPDLRGLGLGTRMTSVALEALRRAGCESIFLASTTLGRPVYDRLGFAVDSAYHEMRGPALPKTLEVNPWRPMVAADHQAWMAFDRLVSGDDRSRIVSRFRDYSWGVFAGDRMVGALVPLPWGGAAASLLPDARPDAAEAMVRMIRTIGSNGTEVMVYPPSENRAALDVLHDQGFEELRTVPRMVLGKRVAWMGPAVWNPLSMGLG